MPVPKEPNPLGHEFRSVIVGQVPPSRRQIDGTDHFEVQAQVALENGGGSQVMPRVGAKGGVVGNGYGGRGPVAELVRSNPPERIPRCIQNHHLCGRLDHRVAGGGPDARRLLTGQEKRESDASPKSINQQGGSYNQKVWKYTEGDPTLPL